MMLVTIKATVDNYIGESIDDVSDFIKATVDNYIGESIYRG